MTDGTISADPLATTDENPAPVIERGHAQEALGDALNEATEAFLRLEAVAMAIARALDA